jgi:hypothetical protein
MVFNFLRPIDLFEKLIASIGSINHRLIQRLHTKKGFFNIVPHLFLLLGNFFVPIFFALAYLYYLIYHFIAFPFAFINLNLFRNFDYIWAATLAAFTLLVGVGLLIYIIIPTVIWIVQVVILTLLMIWDFILLMWFIFVWFLEWIVFFINFTVFFALLLLAGGLLLIGVAGIFSDGDESAREGMIFGGFVGMFVAVLLWWGFVYFIALFSGYTFPEGNAGLLELIFKVISKSPEWAGPIDLFTRWL